MLNPSELYHFETDTDPQELRASVMLVALGGFMDAGHTQRLLTDHLLGAGESTVVASFDTDQMVDYRSRRPAMVFDSNRWLSYDDPCLALHRLVDRDGTPYLLLTGPEPDFQWERMTEAVRQLVVLLGVDLVVSAHGIPMAVPHTRPIGLTSHATDPRLIPVAGQPVRSSRGAGQPVLPARAAAGGVGSRRPRVRGARAALPRPGGVRRRRSDRPQRDHRRHRSQPARSTTSSRRPGSTGPRSPARSRGRTRSPR